MKGKGFAAEFYGRRRRLRSIILVGSALSGVSAGAIPAWAQAPCAGPLVTTSCTNSANLTNTLTISSAASISALSNIGTILLSQMPGPQNGNGIVNNGGDVGMLNNSGTILLSGLHDGYGILNNGGTIVTLVNSGLIGATAKYGAAIYNESGTIATLNNNGTLSGGTISSYSFEDDGVLNDGFIGTLNNNGLIESNGSSNASSFGINESGNGPSATPSSSLQYGIDTLNNNGIIEASGGQSAGISESFGTITNLNNAGSINVTGLYTAFGIVSEYGTITTLDNSGVIDAMAGQTSYGILSIGSINTLNNSGTIETSSISGAGILNVGSNSFGNSYGTITNLNNSGLIAATGTNVDGISNENGTITNLNNSGLITATGTNVDGIINRHGAITTLDNTGSIETTGSFGAGILNIGSNDSGTITNLNNSGLIAATGTKVSGIASYQGAITTLTNAGTIETTGGYGAGILNVGSNNKGTITTLNNSGLITATGTAVGGIVNYQGGIATLDNSGSINTTGTVAVGILNVGSNNSGTITTLNNSGLIATTGAAVGGLVNYQGAIITLTNAGTIDATGSAVSVAIGNYQGTITTLDNSGLLEAKGSTLSVALGNYGTIGTLNNSGTIAGTTDAIWLAGGTLGSLNNSGVISGTIENDSGQALNIAGGSGSVYGVLTGYGATPGTVGSLNSKGANVNFTAGNLLLNDNINAGNATVTNSGATLLVNGPIGVTSSQPFMLSGGMLEVGDINNPNASLTSANGLDISGTGILRGHGTVDANVINGGVVYPGGSIGTLNIDGNYTQTSGGTLQIDLTPGGNSQLAVTGTANLSGAVVVNLSPGSYNPGSPYTVLTAQTVTNTITQVASSGPFAPLFEHYLTPSFDNSIAGATALIFQPTVLANGSMPAFTTGRFYVGSAYAQTNVAQSVLTTPFSTDDNTTNASRGYWLHGIGDFGSANGYNFNSKGFVIGKGFDVSPHLTIGGGLSNVYTTSKAQGSSVDAKSFGVLAYGIYQEDRMTLATSASISFLHNKTTRYLPYLDWTANAANNGISAGFAAKLQYRLLSANSRYFLTPYAQTSYIHSSSSATQEGNAGGLDLSYGRLKTNVTQLGAGAMGGYSLPVKFGQLTAWGSLGGVGTIGNPHASVTEHLGPYTDRQSALAAPIGAFTPAVGLSLQGNRIWHISAGWNGQFGSAISSNNLTLQLGANW